MVICLERDADLHMAQLMPLPLTVSCFRKIQTGFAFLVPAHPGSPGKGPLNGCACVCVNIQNVSSSRLWNRLYRRTVKHVCTMKRFTRRRGSGPERGGAEAEEVDIGHDVAERGRTR